MKVKKLLLICIKTAFEVPDMLQTCLSSLQEYVKDHQFKQLLRLSFACRPGTGGGQGTVAGPHQDSL